MNVIYAVNEFVAYEFEDLLDTSGESGPVYAIQSVPESDPPYLRWTANATSDAEDWWNRRVDIAYQIVDLDTINSGLIVERFNDIFGEPDVAARWFRAWLDSPDVPSWLSGPIFKDFSVNSIEYTGGWRGDPKEQEGGTHTRYASLRVQYNPTKVYSSEYHPFDDTSGNIDGS